MNEYNQDMHMLSVKLHKSNDDIAFIWNKLMQYDIEELKESWKSREVEAYVDIIYSIDKQMKYIFDYLEEICVLINKNLD